MAAGKLAGPARGRIVQKSADVVSSLDADFRMGCGMMAKDPQHPDTTRPSGRSSVVSPGRRRNGADARPRRSGVQHPISQRDPGDVTRLLDRAGEGDDSAARELLPLVYQQLRAHAQQMMMNERAGHTLQATALVHEAYARLIGTDSPSFAGRAHFYAAAAESMRRILIDHAREHGAVKRGRDWTRRAGRLEDLPADSGGGPRWV